DEFGSQRLLFGLDRILQLLQTPLTQRTVRAPVGFVERAPCGAVLGATAAADDRDMDRAIGAARRAFDETDWGTNRALRKRCL
ncbi:hypothetical protein C6A85_14540, partial [Mycobacterium sp. ITM-2017-0098]